MKVFVSYGFNDRDRWICDFVFPIVRSFGHDLLTGEDLAGRPIVDGVSTRIDRSHAIIGFATRRGEAHDGVWGTHRWVLDELAYAKGKKLLMIEVRETAVDPQGGILNDLQHIVYDERQRESCLVELVKAVGGWPRGRVRLQLFGDGIDQQIVPFLRRADFRCVCRFNQDGEETAQVETKVQPIKGGLFIDVPNVPPEALIQVEMSCGNNTWLSQFESLESHNVRVYQGSIT